MAEIILSGIIDSTLREGEQTPGVNFSGEQKLSIIQGLVHLGIDEIEVGIATPRSTSLTTLLEEASGLCRGKCSLSLWSRCRPEDIAFAGHCRADVLSLSIPVSDLHIRERLGRDREWVCTTLVHSIYSAFDQGFAKVSVGLEDATRADFDFLVRLVETISPTGISRIRIADTVGIASPGSMRELVGRIVQDTDVPIGVHTHNDFGMATGNAIAALEAGASWIDATVLGLGERTGNCRLEEVVGYLSLRKGYERYQPSRLNELCQLVARAAGLTIAGQHPLVGKDIFTCETGLHVHGLTGNPETYEPYDPARIGRQRVFCFGGKTGRRAVRARLAALGVSISEEEAENLVRQIRQLAGAGKKSLFDNDLVTLAEQDKVKIKPDRDGSGGIS